MSSDEIKGDTGKRMESAHKTKTRNNENIKFLLNDLQSACANLLEENKLLKNRVNELEHKLNINENIKLEPEHTGRNKFGRRMGALLDGASNKLKINRIKTIKHNDCVLENKICYAHADCTTSIDVVFGRVELADRLAAYPSAATAFCGEAVGRSVYAAEMRAVGYAAETSAGYTPVIYPQAVFPHAASIKTAHVLTSSLDSTVKVWAGDLERCLLIYRGHSHPVNTSKFSSLDDHLVCSGSGDGSVHIWSLKHLTEFSSDTNIESRSHHESMAEEFSKGSDPNIASEKVNINKPLLDMKFHQAPVSSVDWTYDDKNVISGSWDNSLVIWDVEKAKAVLNLNEHEEEVTFVSCHPSQKLFVSASADSTIRLWDMRSAKTPSVSICHGHNGEVNSAIFSGNFIVSGGSDKSCKLWELRTLREPVASLKTSAPVTQISSCSDSILCIPARNGHFRIWNYNQKTSYSFYHRNDDKIYSIESCSWLETSQGKFLYTCSIDGSIVRWNIPTNLSQKH